MDVQSTLTTQSGAEKIGKKTTHNIQKDENFNDLDRLYDVLLHEKHLLQIYSITEHEAFEENLFKLLKDNHMRVESQHKKITEALFNMGEYTADKAPYAQVKDVSDVFMGYLNQLPYKTKVPH